MIQVNDFVRIIPKSNWASKMVLEYGPINRVGKIGLTNTMMVNPDCKSVETNSETFHWGFWIANEEADLERILCISSPEFLRQT